MLIVALALVLLLLILTHIFMRELRARERVHQRHLDLLINQLLHATGKPWVPAPAEEQRAERRSQAERIDWISPEQMPVE